MGDTFPAHFRALDLRLRYLNGPRQRSTFVQDAGRACGYGERPLLLTTHETKRVYRDDSFVRVDQYVHAPAKLRRVIAASTNVNNKNANDDTTRSAVRYHVTAHNMNQRHVLLPDADADDEIEDAIDDDVQLNEDIVSRESVPVDKLALQRVLQGRYYLIAEPQCGKTAVVLHWLRSLCGALPTTLSLTTPAPIVTTAPATSTLSTLSTLTTTAMTTNAATQSTTTKTSGDNLQAQQQTDDNNEQRNASSGNAPQQQPALTEMVLAWRAMPVTQLCARLQTPSGNDEWRRFHELQDAAVVNWHLPLATVPQSHATRGPVDVAVQFIRQYRHSTGDDLVVDLGCGRHAHIAATFANDRRITVKSYDLVADNERVTQADCRVFLNNVTYGTASFVVLSTVFYHNDGVDPLLLQAQALLRSGGILVLLEMDQWFDHSDKKFNEFVEQRVFRRGFEAFGFPAFGIWPGSLPRVRFVPICIFFIIPHLRTLENCVRIDTCLHAKNRIKICFSFLALFSVIFVIRNRRRHYRRRCCVVAAFVVSA